MCEESVHLSQSHLGVKIVKTCVLSRRIKMTGLPPDVFIEAMHQFYVRVLMHAMLN